MRPLACFAALLMLAACGTEGGSAEEGTTTAGTNTTEIEEPTTTGFSPEVSLPDGLLPATLDGIVADAVERTDVPKSEVELISVEAMSFNDAALGCPEPGKMYAQVITPGFLVLIDAGGEDLDYRVAERSDSFRLCE